MTPKPTIPGLTIDVEADAPVYRQIADAIRAAVEDGRLTAGKRLPPTRLLARQLGVNRNTVVAAYDLLVEEGLATGRAGRGTFLVTAAERSRAEALSGAGAWLTSFSRAVEGPGVGGLLSVYRVAVSSDGISFAASYPASDLMPVEPFRKAMTRVLRDRGPEVLSYGPPSGFAPLRESIAAEMRHKGSRVDPDAILITNGSQQAIELVLRAFVDPGDAVVIEDPTYTGALSVLASLGARLVGVPVDHEGVRPDLLALALERHRPRVLYVQPTFHNPTTRVMGEARRREVLEIAARYACIVVEDDWAGDLRFEGEDLPSLHQLDGGGRVIYLSTFSKKLLPGLRVGWVTAPPAVLQRLLVLKQIEDHGTSPLVQAALHAFLEEGGLEDHLLRVRSVYRDRRDAMLEALTAHMPEGVTWTKPEGGLFLWLTMPEAVDGAELFLAARARGVIVSKGELFHVEGRGGHTMRLTFSSATPEQITRGIAILGKLVGERSPRGSRMSRDEALEAVPIL